MVRMRPFLGRLEVANKTSLYDQHRSLKAKIIDFGGWDMPVSYGSPMEEHQAVRTKVGVFDVSHMGEIEVSGDDATKYLQYVSINDVTRLKPGQGQYTAILNEQGGMIDDLILYRLGEAHYLLCVNASNINKDYAWLQKQTESFNVEIVNRSDDYSQIAIQGPESAESIAKVVGKHQAGALDTLAYMDIAEFDLFGAKALIARTGYTGEKGYELYLSHEAATKVWASLVEAGVKPAGLGARDTLRLEACYNLYGNEMDEEVTPLESGIAWAVRLEKGPFIGRDALQQQKNDGVPRKLVAFVMEDKGIARGSMGIYKGGELIGKVSSGSFLPSLNQAGGMALVGKNSVKLDEQIEVDIRGKRKLAKIIKRPLYSARVK